MSRYNPRHDIQSMLKAAELWEEQCMLANGSLLDNGLYWTAENLAELDLFQCSNTHRKKPLAPNLTQ